jgi:hypothetical protein
MTSEPRKDVPVETEHEEEVEAEVNVEQPLKAVPFHPKKSFHNWMFNLPFKNMSS